MLFESRWALSYLAGPLTRDQIRRLKAQRVVGGFEVGGSPSLAVAEEVSASIREMFEETNLNVRHLSTFAVHETTRFVQNKSKLQG